MENISLEFAQTLCGDDQQSIKRGYISVEIIRDAQELAQAVVQMPTFGQFGYLAEIGSPHQWWASNCPTYRYLEQKDIYGYGGARKFANMLLIANHIVQDEKIERVRARLEALILIQEFQSEEYRCMSAWLNTNEFI